MTTKSPFHRNVDFYVRDRTILMLSTSEARTQTAPQPPSQFTAKSQLLPRSAVSRRPLAEWGPSCPEGPRPKHRDPLQKTLFTARIFRFQTSISSQAMRTWMHGSPVTRRERKQ